MRILVTRPPHQAQSLSSALEALGAEVVLFPTLKITPVGDQALVKETLEKADIYDVIIFITANAVFNAIAYVLSITEKTRIIAMGPATARALEEAGFKSVIPEAPYTSESLLELPELADISTKKVLIVKGEGGLNTVANTLSARGAQVTQLPVYRRECPDSDPEILLSFLKNGANRVITTTSGESVRNLVKLTPDTHKKALFKTPLFVVSPRVEKIAREVGEFEEIIVAQSAQDEAIVAKIKERYATM